MNSYSVNGQTVTTNLNRNQITSISRPIISYPYTFTGSIRQISQEFIVGSSNVPPFNPTLTHPIYNNAHIISQSEANVDPMGFAKFTRTYIEFTQSEIIFPTTMTYTYPTMWIGINTEKRGLEPLLNDNDEPIKPLGLRRNPLTQNISVEERIELIYVGSGLVDTETLPSDIPIGSVITANGHTWNLVSNDSGNATLSRVDEDGETVTIQQNLGGGNYTYLNTDTDFTKIPHTMKYSIKDAYQTWGDSIIIDSRNPHSSEVDFVDNVTSPSVYGYLATSRSRTKVPLASSTLEHLGGYVYMKKTLWGYLN